MNARNVKFVITSSNTNNILIMGIQDKKEKGIEVQLAEKIITENFPDLCQEVPVQIPEYTAK